MTAPNTLYIKVRIPVEWRASYINISLVIGLKKGKDIYVASVMNRRKFQNHNFCGPFFWQNLKLISV